MLTIDFDKPVPIFPLPNCVLLPHATIPLHIFEPRYRAMTRDTLRDNSLMAMALFDGSHWKSNYLGNPPLRPHVCVGYIARHERLEDGRFNLLLQGVCRAQLLREVPHEPYRLAMLSPIEIAPVMEIDLDEPRKHIEQLLSDPLLKELASVSAIHNWLSSEIPTAALIDLATMATCESIESRYKMLAEPSVQSRASWLERELRQMRRALAIAQKLKQEELEGLISLN